jgi:diguanylate cyclase (GGDEF)-like protein
MTLPAEPKADILVVDDLPDNLLVYQCVLEELGQNLVLARTGEEALKHLLEREFAVILLDVNMPGIDGFEVCRRLQERPETAFVPVLFVTAQVLDKGSVCKGLAQGAIDYITKPFDPDELAARVRNALRLKEQNDRLRLMALTDPLTGLGNRHIINGRLKSSLARWRRRGEPFGLMIVDVDHFKAVNDTYGHEAGDQVLQRLAELFREMARAEDSVGRLGGEEFVILVDHAHRLEAVQAAERLRRRVSHLAMPLAGNVSITVSIGVVSSDDLHVDDTEKSALHHADDALYAAKETGRNRVVYFPNLSPSQVGVEAMETSRPMGSATPAR